MRQKLRGILLWIIFVSIALAAYADTVTLSTFYPSPYGSYQKLDATDETHLATSTGSLVVGGTGTGLTKLQVIHGNDKITAGPASVVGFTTSDASNPLGVFFKIGGGETPADRYTAIQSAELSLNTNALSLQPEGGNVGIGTTAPTNDLSFGGNAARVIQMERHTTVNTAGNAFTLQAGASTTGAANRNGGDLILSSGTSTGSGSSNIQMKVFPNTAAATADNAATTSLYVQGSTGNVGIGTTTPTALLQVQGGTNQSIKLKNDFGSQNGDIGIILQRAATNSYGIVQFMTGENFEWLIGERAGGNRDFKIYSYGAAVDALTILGSNGNVGINTNNPLGKLDVNGSIFQSGVSLHADYVFEPDYLLPSIDEQAKMMWRDKHLPAMQTNKKDEQGNDVVEIGRDRRGLTEELEKAHIYIQQLHEKLKKQDKQIEEIKIRLSELESQQIS